MWQPNNLRVFREKIIHLLGAPGRHPMGDGQAAKFAVSFEELFAFKGPWQVVVELRSPDDKSVIAKYDRTDGQWTVC